MTNMLKRAWNLLLDLLFPPRCDACDQVVVIGQMLCSDCMEILSGRDGRITCVSCRKEANACTCAHGESILCASPFHYDGGIRKVILAFKFRKKLKIMPLLAQAMGDSVGTLEVPTFDLLCAVPMSKERLAERTFNQAEMLAEELGAQLGIPCMLLLTKICENQIQHRLSGMERKENVRGVYTVTAGQQVRGKNILLCDDIITTGSTLRECAHVLKTAGAACVFCVTAATT